MRRLTPLALSLSFACAPTTPPAQVAPPPPPSPSPSAPPVVEAPVEPAPPVRDVDGALALVEQGRAVQTERGEGGADDAIAAYRQALVKDPQCGAALWELGWSLQVKGELDAAVAAWDELRVMAPEYPELDVHYPVLLMRRDHARALAALPDPSDIPPPEETPRAGPTLSIHAVGDVHMGRAWPESRAKLPPNDAADLFMHVAEWLQNAEVTFGNLETALRDEGDSIKCGPKSTKCFAFRVPTSFAKALKDAGFDVMSIANNHAGDFGQEGRQSTIAALDGIGILHSGPVGDLASWETNGLKIGLAAFSTGADVYRIQDIELGRRVVADLARRHDLVIVSFHGGAEGAAASKITREAEVFYGEARGNPYAFAHAMVDAGADLVLGHGPHRLRAMELYRGRLIAYSLGNFSTWETFSLDGALGVSVVLRAELAPNGVLTAAKLMPVKIEKPGRPAPDASNEAIKIIRTLSRQDFGDPIFDAAGLYQRLPAVSQLAP